MAPSETQKSSSESRTGGNWADGSRDSVAAVAAIGLLAYASADVAHHALGHGGACLALGGRIISLSSVFVNCTVRGAAVDLAGPFANLVIGLVALAVAYYGRRRLGPAMRLFLALTAGFNLLWFTMQLSFSALTRTDDFAWAMVQFHVGALGRYALIALGALGYVVSIRAVVKLMAGFGPRMRARSLVLTSWLTAGALACLTAAFDSHPIAAILHHAAPQSMLLSIGLLFVPGRIVPQENLVAPRIGFSVRWVLAACIVAAASVVWLGPGVAI